MPAARIERARCLLVDAEDPEVSLEAACDRAPRGHPGGGGRRRARPGRRGAARGGRFPSRLADVRRNALVGWNGSGRSRPARAARCPDGGRDARRSRLPRADRRSRDREPGIPDLAARHDRRGRRLPRGLRVGRSRRAGGRATAAHRERCCRSFVSRTRGPGRSADAPRTRSVPPRTRARLPGAIPILD